MKLLKIKIEKAYQLKKYLRVNIRLLEGFLLYISQKYIGGIKHITTGYYYTLKMIIW